MAEHNNDQDGIRAKFALEAEIEIKATGRRNRLLGHWAGELMGLEADHLEDYAAAVSRPELINPDGEAVLRKVAKDLSGSGLATTESQVRRKMDEFLAVARNEIQEGR